MVETDAWIGLGSNLDNPVEQIRTAVAELGDLAGCSLRAASSLYRSPPMGPADQPDYVNAVARLGTGLAALALLDALHDIEMRHGRKRGRHWGERTLDLDLLVYGREVIDTQRLTLPHPGIAERNFVLYPLAELDRGLVIPGLGRIEDLLERCPDTGLSRIEQ